MNNLYNYLKKYKNDNIALGFSGGNDSSFLLLILKNLKFNVIPVFVSTELTKSAIQLAKKNSKILGFNLEVIKIETLNINEIRYNTTQRCYWCKNRLYSEIKNKFKNHTIFDGTNFTDTFSYRPGIKALEELGIISPLKECEVKKSQIIEFLKTNKPELISKSYSCIATKYPYNIDLKKFLR